MNTCNFSQSKILSSVDGDNGYYLGRLSNEELFEIKALIKEQYLARILCLEPSFSQSLNNVEMSQYHLVYQGENHRTLWPKSARILGPKAAASIKAMPFFRELERQLGSIDISGEDGSGWEEIYWRIVRPGTSDVGDFHADKWFWDFGHGTVDAGKRRIKIWMAIDTVPGKSGLRIIKNSHLKKDWLFHGEVDHTGKQKPKFDEPFENLNIENLETIAGDFVVFHDELIHAGMPNLSDQTRISLEATLLVSK